MFFSAACSIINSENENNKLLENIDNSYDSILNNWVNLFKELKINNSIEICDFITYLLYNGYFSKDKKLYYQVENRLNSSHNYAFDIMNGNGVCLNFSYFLETFLNKLGLLVSNLSVDASKTYTKYKPNIKTTSVTNNKFSFLDEIIYFLSNTPNHSCTLICDNDLMFIYDITNLTYFKIENIKKASIIGGEGTYKLRYKYNCENAILFMDSDDNFNLNILAIKNIEKHMNYVYPCENEIIDGWKKTYDILDTNKSLIDDCYFETREDINNIANYVEIEKKKVLKK